MSTRFGSMVKSMSTRNSTMDNRNQGTTVERYNALEDDLGPGPMRFATPINERPTQLQVESLKYRQRKSFYYIKRKWQSRTNRKTKKGEEKINLEEVVYLNFVRFCGENEKEKNVWTTVKRCEHHYLRLSAKDLESQLSTKTLFPVPGLKTKDGGYDVFYMRPSRYLPKMIPTQDVIDNLAYVMHNMAQRTEHASTNGIGFLANMNGWTMSNFSLSYCYQFMMILQGKVVPAKVMLFLIVNPPDWFDSIWQIMKPMLADSFRNKVHMITEDQLPNFLQDDYERYLPDEMASGTANTNAIVRDYIAYRLRVECDTCMSSSTSTTSANNPAAAKH